MGAISSVTTSRKVDVVMCQNGHPHHNVEDAKACQDYYSTRLKEQDQLKQLDRMVYNNRTDRVHHPYKYTSSQTAKTTKRTEDTSGSDEVPESGVRIEEVPDKDADETRKLPMVDKQCMRETIAHTPPSDVTVEKTESHNTGITSIFFGKTETFTCPLHHEHKTQMEAEECRRNTEERERRKHEEHMEAKYRRGKSNGLKHPISTQNTSSPSDEDEVD